MKSEINDWIKNLIEGVIIINTLNINKNKIEELNGTTTTKAAKN